MPPESQSALRPVPRPGMFAIVRNRRGVITTVERSDDAKNGRLHLVHVEYKDDQLPYAERLLWELEPRSRLLEPNSLPVPSSGLLNTERLLEFYLVLTDDRPIWRAQNGTSLDSTKKTSRIFDGNLTDIPIPYPEVSEVRN